MNRPCPSARRDLLIALALATFISLHPRALSETSGVAPNLFTIDARVAPTAPETGYLVMGSGAADRSPSGHRLEINSRYLTLDGKPWFPVMGEFHYSRYPERFWEDEILKMKAGGIQIVSTYVFWIHHEEVQGQFDWSGRRNLRHFVELCAKHGLYVWARIGPWAHGEVRNGGLPDWLLAKGPTRVNDPGYLASVRSFYDAIGLQLRGLLWKDGGPVIGVQLENEYTNRAANGGAAHITTLKQMALAAGLDVPVYTVTGWDHTVYPPRTVTPVFGGYPDEAWSGSRVELPPDTQGVYQFAPGGGNAGILQERPSAADPVQFRHYPRFTAELGAGMEDTYHRRVVVAADDVSPIAITALGSGVTLLGYYMYHGGTNPDGRLTTLQESQATNYPNDVPVKSYDFQAPLGEFGQVNESYRKLKVIHQFIADFGSELAPMTPMLPDRVPSGMADTTTLRVAARTDGTHGFLFFNNYIRHYPMPEQRGVQVVLRLPTETLTMPHAPIDIPSQTAFFWPVNLDLADARLRCATAQPMARLAEADSITYFFVTCAGLAPEFDFVAPTVASVRAISGQVFRHDDEIDVRGVRPSTTEAIDVRTHSGRMVRIVLLSPAEAENAWVVPTAGRERMVLTRANVFDDQGTLHVRSRDPGALSIEVFPDVRRPLTASAPVARVGMDGLFARYDFSVAARENNLNVAEDRPAGPVAPVRMGPPFDWRHGSVAMAPDESAFVHAADWKLRLPLDLLNGVCDVTLVIRYAGDVARLDAGNRLLDDNFYNGTSWEIGVRELAPAILGQDLHLEILPLRQDAPIYLPKTAWPVFAGKPQVADLVSIRAMPEYEVTVTAATVARP